MSNTETVNANEVIKHLLNTIQDLNLENAILRTQLKTINSYNLPIQAEITDE